MIRALERAIVCIDIRHYLADQKIGVALPLRRRVVLRIAVGGGGIGPWEILMSAGVAAGVVDADDDYRRNPVVRDQLVHRFVDAPL